MHIETSNEVVLFGADGCCPVLQWLDRLPRRVQQKCAARVWLLQQRRVTEGGMAAPDDAVRHLAITSEGKSYFLFYSVSGFRTVILHACSCSSVPDAAEFKIAESRKAEFERDQEAHIFTE